MSKKINFNKEDEKNFVTFLEKHESKINKQFNFKDTVDGEITFLELRIVLKLGDEHIVEIERYNHHESINTKSKVFKIVEKDTQKLLKKFLTENKGLKDKSVTVRYIIEDIEYDLGNRIANVDSEITFDKKVEVVKDKKISQ